jgi:large subunit ribosomal protein L18
MNKQFERRKLRKRYRLKTHNYNKLPRFSIFRSNKNLSVQIIDDEKSHTLVAVSSLEKALVNIKGYNVEGAEKLGKIIAERALEKKIHQVVFDIGAYKYHGKIKAIVEAAKAAGLNKEEKLEPKVKVAKKEGK